MLWRIALRNVLRHRRRSRLMAATIILSFALLIVFTGLADGGHRAMAEIGVRMGIGHVVVYPNGYRQDPSLDRLIEAPETVSEAVAKLGPKVLHAAPRLRTDGLVQAGSNSIGVSIAAVDPNIEPQVSKISSPAAIAEGQTLAARIQSGPSSAGLPPITMGKALANNLGIRVGDRAVLTVRPRGSNEIQSGAFEVCGIFETGVREVDAFSVQIPLEAGQRLTHAGRGVTMVALLLDDIDDAGRTAEHLGAMLPGSTYDVLPWQRAAPDLHASIVVDEGGMYVFMVIIFIVVGAGILNAILMSVLERTREFGVLLALGTSPARVVAIVFAEAITVGVVSVGIGLGLGLWANHYFAIHGLDIKAMGSAPLEAGGILLPEKFYAVLAPGKVIWSTACVLTLVLLGAAYPAAHAARLEPTEALHHV